jgi:hypothetical protein
MLDMDAWSRAVGIAKTVAGPISGARASQEERSSSIKPIEVQYLHLPD